MQALMKAFVKMRAPGPDLETRQRGYCDVWGEARNADGKVVTGTLTTPEAYRFTALGALASVQKIQESNPGAWTPSQAFGAEFVASIEGVEVHGVAPGSTEGQG